MNGSRCDDCGRFFRPDERATWAEIYDMIGMGLDRERHRCALCTESLGPAQSNARPHDGDLSPYQGQFSSGRGK